MNTLQVGLEQCQDLLNAANRASKRGEIEKKKMEEHIMELKEMLL